MRSKALVQVPSSILLDWHLVWLVSIGVQKVAMAGKRVKKLIKINKHSI